MTGPPGGRPKAGRVAVKRDDLSVAQKALRSLGVGVILATAVLATGLTVRYLSGDGGSASTRLALAISMVGASVACFAMLVDAFDFWLLGRRMTPFSVKMTRSLVFVAMLVAIGLSLAVAGTALLLVLTPALMIYLFGVARRRPPATGRPSGAVSRGAARTSRQKRGGKTRR